MSIYRDLGAMPDGHNAIRMDFDDDEPQAVVFHDQALPGALVSWAWCQLVALNSLLDAFVMTRRTEEHGGPDIAAAVQATLIPVINALEFSEERAHALRTAASAPQDQPVKQGGGM